MTYTVTQLVTDFNGSAGNHSLVLNLNINLNPRCSSYLKLNIEIIELNFSWVAYLYLEVLSEVFKQRLRVLQADTLIQFSCNFHIEIYWSSLNIRRVPTHKISTMFQLSNLSLLALVIFGALTQSYSFRPAGFRRSNFIYAVKNSASEITPVVAGTVAPEVADTAAIVTDYSQAKMGMCCDEDFCFPEPPATETGADKFCRIPPRNLLDISIFLLHFLLLHITSRSYYQMPVNEKWAWYWMDKPWRWSCHSNWS